MTAPDPREGLDPENPGGLIEAGKADIPGVQDRGPADAEEKAEQAGRAGQPTPVPPADEE